MIQTHSQTLPDWLYRQLTQIELHSLIVLSEHPGYAYDIAQRITRHFSPDKPPTPQGISRALTRMSAIGWIAPYPHMRPSGRKERAYSLTGFGEAQLITEISRLELLIDHAKTGLHRYRIREMPKVPNQNAALLG